MKTPENLIQSHHEDTGSAFAAPPLFQVSNIVHDYHDQPVLQIENLLIHQRSIVGLMGPNGSGKSTLLKLLAFAVKPSEGEIRYLGKPAHPFSPEVRFRVTLLPQEPYLMKRSVYENLRFGLKLRGEKTKLDGKIEQALAWVGFSEQALLRRKWHELSGGEIQRVALAARLVLKPSVLLLDEPTTNVDADSAVLIRQAALRAKEKWGTTLVIASHDWLWLYEVCDKVLHLYKGRLYGTQMENIVSGPWQDQGDGFWAKVMKDGQKVRVPEPPSPDAIALFQFEPDPAMEKDIGPAPRTDAVTGTITRLIYDHNTGDIIATVSIGSVSVFVRCSGEKIKEWQRIPGDKLRLVYDIHAVKWL